MLQTVDGQVDELFGLLGANLVLEIKAASFCFSKAHKFKLVNEQ